MLDMQMLLPSSQAGSGLTRMTWKQLTLSLASKLGLTRPRYSQDPVIEPLQDEQDTAVSEIIPRLKEFSAALNKKLTQAWWDLKVPRVYNYDWELDDHWRLTPLAQLLREQRKLVSTPEELPRTIILAGDRNGLFSGTYEQVVKWLDLNLGSRGEVSEDDDEGVTVWKEFNLKLLDGAELRQTSDKDWKAGRTTGPTERTLQAAKRLEKELGDDQFIFHGCTSAVLPACFSDKLKDNCILPAMTNAFFIHPDGTLRRSANGNFDPASLWQIAQWKRPTLYSHGGLFSYDAQTFNDMRAWPKALKTKVVDPSFNRRQIQESMRLGTKWMHQVEAELCGTHDGDYLPIIDQRAIDVLAEQGRDTSYLSEETRTKSRTRLSDAERKALGHAHFWLDDALRAKAYDKKKTNQTWTMRMQGLESKILNPLSNSLADYLMSHADRPECDGIYLPCRIDLEGLCKGRTDIGEMYVDPKNYNAVLPVLGDETRLERQFDEDVREAHRHVMEQAAKDGVELHEVVDESLAMDLKTWYALQKRTAEAILTRLDQVSQGIYESDKSEESLAELRERMRRIVSLCDTGPMALHIRSILSSAETGTGTQSQSERSE